MTVPDTRAVVGALVLAAAILPSAAQGPADSGQVFRSAVDVVRVDAYPRRDGRIVEGLRAEDFRIFEDGQLQTIDSFEFIRHQPGPIVERTEPTSAAEAERWLADPTRRIFIIYFDLYHITRASSHAVRGPLLDALKQLIGPSDLVAFMTPETPVGSLAFTQTLNTLSAEIARYWEWGLLDAPFQPRTPAEAQLAACGNANTGYGPFIGQIRDRLLFTSLESLIARMGALRQERTHIIFLSEGWENTAGGVSLIGSRNRPRSSSSPRRNQGRIELPMQENMFSRSSDCAMLLLREEALDLEQRFHRLIREANAANVSFHTIDVGGLRTTTAAAAHTRMLQELAENTDGVWTAHSNDIALGFRRPAEATAAYYVMGYTSTNTVIDGGYRRISVEVAARGVSVTARRGYFAGSSVEQELAAVRDARTAVPAPEAEALGVLSRWRTDEDILGRGTLTSEDVEMIVEIGARAFSNGRWRSGADVEIELSDADGRVERFGGQLAAGTRSLELRLAITAGWHPTRAHIVVRNDDQEASTRVDVLPAADAWLGAARFLRSAATGRVAPQPVSAPIFRRGERLRAEWRPASPPDGGDVRLLDRRGQPLAPGAALVAAFDPHTGLLTAELHLGALAEGEYLLEASGSRNGQSERQLAAFQVTR